MRYRLAALSVAICLAGVNPGITAAKDTVKIAFIGPLTGGVSANGLGGRNSADLAVRLRNADPKSQYDYELAVLDDECKPNIGVQVARRRGRSQDHRGVTHYCSAVAMGAGCLSPFGAGHRWRGALDVTAR
jgi:branched-chain amino acid transport system substrate-binding protein